MFFSVCLCVFFVFYIFFLLDCLFVWNYVYACKSVVWIIIVIVYLLVLAI